MRLEGGEKGGGPGSAFEDGQFIFVGFAGDEVVYDGVIGVFDLLGGSVDDEFSFVEHDDAVGDFERGGHVVGDDDAGGA